MPLNQPPQAAPLLDDERTYRLEANGLQLRRIAQLPDVQAIFPNDLA